MIEILLSFFCVNAGGLQMTVEEVADPYIFPGRRDRKFLDPQKFVLVDNFFSVPCVNKISAAFHTRDAGVLI